LTHYCKDDIKIFSSALTHYIMDDIKILSSALTHYSKYDIKIISSFLAQKASFISFIDVYIGHCNRQTKWQFFQA
jgi:hypothetical protein